MVLITGHVIRKYQLPDHRPYQHGREQEGAYWKKLGETDILSRCSVDGIDFESRGFAQKEQGNSMVPFYACMYVHMHVPMDKVIYLLGLKCMFVTMYLCMYLSIYL